MRARIPPGIDIFAATKSSTLVDTQIANHIRTNRSSEFLRNPCTQETSINRIRGILHPEIDPQSPANLLELLTSNPLSFAADITGMRFAHH